MKYIFSKIKKTIQGKVILSMLFLLLIIGSLSTIILTIVSKNARQQALAETYEIIVGDIGDTGVDTVWVADSTGAIIYYVVDGYLYDAQTDALVQGDWDTMASLIATQHEKFTTYSLDADLSHGYWYDTMPIASTNKWVQRGAIRTDDNGNAVTADSSFVALYKNANPNIVAIQYIYRDDGSFVSKPITSADIALGNTCLGSGYHCGLSFFDGHFEATEGTSMPATQTSAWGGNEPVTVDDNPPADPPTPTPPGPTPTPPPSMRIISGNFLIDEGATIDPLYNICKDGGLSSTYPTVSNITFNPNDLIEGPILNINQDQQFSYYTAYTNAGSNYTVTLELDPTPNSDGDIYACSCPSSLTYDPTSIYNCQYSDLGDNQLMASFFLKQYNLLNGGWWQVAGGNAYALNDMTSKVPYEGCVSETFCYPGIMANNPLDTITKDTTGLAMVGLGQIFSHRTDTTGEGSYVMVPDSRTGDAGDNARALGVSIPQQNFAYFMAKIGNKTQIAGSNQPPSSGTYIYNNDVTINDLNPWVIGDNESMIVFINGNLNFDDTSDGNKLTQVSSNGGYLGFIVSGNINISSNVGYEDPSVSANAASSNIEGVFITDGDINIQTRGVDIPDKKFIGAGTFVGYSGINNDRDFSDGDLGAINNNIYAAETFIYRPDLLLNTPQEMKSANYHWQEIAPSSS